MLTQNYRVVAAPSMDHRGISGEIDQVIAAWRVDFGIGLT